MQHGDALSQLRREIARARTRLAAERALRAALPLALGIAAWVSLWLFGVPERAPGLAQSLGVIAFLIVLAWAGLRVRAAYRPPSAAEARARLAADSRLDLGAFEALEDLPAKLDPVGVALWRREQERARERAGGARAGPLRPALNTVDRFGLRYLAAIALVAGAIVAGPESLDRLTRAFTPDPGPLVGDGPLEIEAWLTPAPYTRAAPISLSDQIGARIESPPSVTATVRVTGPRDAPRLLFDGRGGRREARFARAADGAYEARLTIPGPGRLRVVRFLTRATWRLAPAADAAPLAAFTTTPSLLADNHVRFGWSARDDFGVRAMALRVRPLNPPDGLKDASPIDTPFESPPGDPHRAEAAADLDLTRHPYAGMLVEARVVAFDALGQAGESAPVRITLPERVFLQPLARAAIEIRKMILWERRPYAPVRRPPGPPAMMNWFEPLFGVQRLVIRTDDQDPRLERAPAAIRRAGHFIDALTAHPEDGYFRDRAVFLGFRAARAEINVARNIDDTSIAAETLWRTAMRAEYGGSADARRALDAAQKALADALASGASAERIQQLMQALRQATENYLQARLQEALQSGQAAQSEDDAQEKTEISQRDIDNLMQEVERLAQEGRTQEAQALLERLAGLLQNLDVRLSEGGQGQGGQQRDGEDGLSQSMDALSNAIGEQRALNDDTQQQQDGGQQQQGAQQQGGGTGEQDGAGLAERQDAIRAGVEAAQNAASQAGAPSSDALSAAQQNMRRAENALRQGDFAGARAAQDQALASLREGAGDLAAEIRRRGEAGNRSASGGERDPLGREAAGVGAGDGDTNVPTQSDRVRAREILDDIRRRAEDPNRPQAERDYLHRLLDRFNGA
ncbi:MAG: DUF4175 family protein [Hyphomonadaceae bacterium]